MSLGRGRFFVLLFKALKRVVGKPVAACVGPEEGKACHEPRHWGSKDSDSLPGGLNMLESPSLTPASRDLTAVFFVTLLGMSCTGASVRTGRILSQVPLNRWHWTRRRTWLPAQGCLPLGGMLCWPVCKSRGTELVEFTHCVLRAQSPLSLWIVTSSENREGGTQRWAIWGCWTV